MCVTETCDTKVSQKKFVSLKGTETEMQRLQKAWTKSGLFPNRSQFIRAAINAYAGEQVFD